MPLALAASAAFALLQAPRVTPVGAALAVASGAVTSALGYALWYAALRGLAATQAADRAALGPPARGASGACWRSVRAPSLRLLLASGLILGGIALAFAARRRRSTRGKRLLDPYRITPAHIARI